MIPASAVTVVAVRASGPGGQNVNKVSSKVEVRVDVAAIRGLRPDARARLLVLAAGRLDADGKILVTSQRTRDRERNLADALDKVSDLVARALIAPTPRRPTRPTRGSVERRLTAKRREAERKTMRRGRQEG